MAVARKVGCLAPHHLFLSGDNLFVLFKFFFQSKPPAPKRESLLPVSSSSKENGVRVEQDDQDLFAGESVCPEHSWGFLPSELGAFCILATCEWLDHAYRAVSLVLI